MGLTLVEWLDRVCFADIIDKYFVRFGICSIFAFMLISRWWHSKGFGVQSPWAYKLVTTVLCDRKNLMPRLKAFLGDEPRWELVEDIRGRNRTRWREIVADSDATATFDMWSQGLVVYDPKRWKQHYKI